MEIIAEVRSFYRPDGHEGRPCKLTGAAHVIYRSLPLFCLHDPFAGAALMAVRSVVRPNLLFYCSSSAPANFLYLCPIDFHYLLLCLSIPIMYIANHLLSVCYFIQQSFIFLRRQLFSWFSCSDSSLRNEGCFFLVPVCRSLLRSKLAPERNIGYALESRNGFSWFLLELVIPFSFVADQDLFRSS